MTTRPCLTLDARDPPTAVAREHPRARRHALRARPRGHVGPRSRRAAAEDPAADRAADQVQAFAVYLLDEQRRGAARSPTRSAIPEDVRANAAAEGRAGPGRRRGRRRPADPRQRRPRRSALRRGRCRGIARRAGRAAAPQGHASSARSTCSATPSAQFTETDETMLRQFGAHVAVAIENARLFEHERALHRARSRRWPRSAASSASILNLDELLTRIANLTAPRHRLPHLRHPAAQRGDAGARDEGRRPLRRQGRPCRASSSATASSATRRCTRSRCSCPTCRRIRATSSWSTTRARSW